MKLIRLFVLILGLLVARHCDKDVTRGLEGKERLICPDAMESAK